MKGISVVKQQHIPDNSQKDKKKVDKNVWKKSTVSSGIKINQIKARR